MTGKRTPAWPQATRPLPVHLAPGFALRAAEQRRLAIWRRLVGDFPSTPLFALLLGMNADPGAHQQTLSDRLFIDKATVTTLLHTLERRGLVTRLQDQTDGRRRTLAVSQDVDSLIAHAAELAPRVDDELLQRLTTDERRELTGLLTRTAHPDASPPTTSDALETFLASPGWLLRRTRQLHAQYWEEEAPLLTPPQYAALDVLYYDGPLEVLATARKASLEESNGARLLTRLADRGFIERLRAETDARRIVLRITATGVEVTATSTPGVKRVQSRVIAPLQADEADALHRLLKRIARF